MPTTPTLNLADMWELVVPHVTDRTALVVDDRASTYGELEERSNRLANLLAAQGIGPGDHVGIYAYNCAQWVETLWAVFKLRAVWININYRYVEDELAYIFENADLKALVHQPEFSDRVAAVMPDLTDLRHTLVIGDEYEAALAASSPDRDFAPRSGDEAASAASYSAAPRPERSASLPSSITTR